MARRSAAEAARSRAGVDPAPPRTGSLYRGDPGMWAWVAHRITGVLTFFFLFLYVLDTALIRISPQTYDAVMSSYRNPLVALLQVVVVGAVLYHALNGIRVMVIDFSARAARHQRRLLAGVLVLWLVAMVPAGYLMLRLPVLTIVGTPS